MIFPLLNYIYFFLSAPASHWYIEFPSESLLYPLQILPLTRVSGLKVSIMGFGQIADSSRGAIGGGSLIN